MEMTACETTDLRSLWWTQQGKSPTLEGPFHLLLSQLLLWSCCHPGLWIPQCTACTQQKAQNNLQQGKGFNSETTADSPLFMFALNDAFLNFIYMKVIHPLFYLYKQFFAKSITTFLMAILLYLTLTDVWRGPVRAVGNSLVGGHRHLLPYLGIWVQTGALRGDLQTETAWSGV